MDNVGIFILGAATGALTYIVFNGDAILMWVVLSVCQA